MVKVPPRTLPPELLDRFVDGGRVPITAASNPDGTVRVSVAWTETDFITSPTTPKSATKSVTSTIETDLIDSKLLATIGESKPFFKGPVLLNDHEPRQIQSPPDLTKLDPKLRAELTSGESKDLRLYFDGWAFHVHDKFSEKALGTVPMEDVHETISAEAGGVSKLAEAPEIPAVKLVDGQLSSPTFFFQKATRNRYEEWLNGKPDRSPRNKEEHLLYQEFIEKSKSPTQRRHYVKLGPSVPHDEDGRPVYQKLVQRIKLAPSGGLMIDEALMLLHSNNPHLESYKTDAFS